MRGRTLLFLCFYLALVLAENVGLADNSEQTAAALPLCPASLRSDSPDFSEQRKHCDFNRKKLPPCPMGMASLDSVRDFTGELRTNPQRRNCTKEWTIIGYLAMNNNLDEFGEENLNDLAWGKALDTQNSFDIIVEAHFAKRPAKRYVFEANPETGLVTDSVFKDFRGQYDNSGDPRTLEDLLSWALEEFPSRHYFFIVGGHGDGWAATVPREHKPFTTTPAASAKEAPPAAATTLDSSRTGNGIAYDATYNDWLSIPDLRLIFTRVENIFLGGERIDVYAADACFMQQAEVAYELRHQARFIYGSIPVMAYQGLPYLQMLANFSSGRYTSLSENPGYDPARQLAMDLPAMMVNAYKDKNNRVYASVVDTDSLENDFAEPLVELGKAAKAWLERSQDPLADRFFVTSILSDTRSYQDSVIELKDFLLRWQTALLERSIHPGSELKTSDESDLTLVPYLQKVLESLNKVVISSAWGDYYTKNKAGIGGLSIWFPSSIPALIQFEKNIQSSRLHHAYCYCNLHEYKLNAWNSFIHLLFTPPVVTDPIHVPPIFPRAQKWGSVSDR